MTIYLEDIPGGKVKVVADPSFEQIVKMDISGNNLTSAQGYGICALNAIRKEAANNAPTKLLIPRIGRA